jgi:gliding motility-associated-like protein
VVNVAIYNRWGNMVYSWTEDGQYWEGLDFQHTPVPEGVYFYVIEFAGYLEQVMKETGHIDLFR